MPKSPHEALHRIFQEDATLFARTLHRVLGVDFPQTRVVSVLNTDVTETEPVERRLDTALLVETAAGDNHVVVIESQSKPEESRRRSWPYYVAYLNNKHQCPVTLLVVTADQKTAGWARKPILTGLPQRPAQVTLPLVLAPDNVPAIQDPAAAGQDVMMTVLSALTHRNQPHVGGILETLAKVLGEVDQGTAAFLAMFTEVGLGDSPAAHRWRLLMTSTIPDLYRRSQMFNQWMEQSRQEGQQEGRAVEAVVAVLRVLQARGLEVPESTADRVRAIADLDELESLLTRAATVSRAEDIFDG